MAAAAAPARPVVSVRSASVAGKAVGQAQLPTVLVSPIRSDVVHDVHARMAMNKRQAYGVYHLAGMQHSAESWGTGRAVSRIPRVSGGGTGRGGQGAFGNMCRGGRMFNPTKVWRRWHRKINVGQRRFALASALAASALPALVMARGHRISRVSDVPCVVADDVQKVSHTKEALKVLAALRAMDDVKHVKASKKTRAGKGKMRNRRTVQRRGPLVIYAKDEGITRAFRNIPGVELACVDRLNLLQLAPGGHLGRFCVWTESAFNRLDTLYGSPSVKSNKKGFVLPRSVLTNANISSIINSATVQAALRPKRRSKRVPPLKRNPLKNRGTMQRLNPAAKAFRKHATAVAEKNAKARKEALAAKAAGTAKSRVTDKQKKVLKASRAGSRRFMKNLLAADQ
eukprot:TRINITY_DN2072_c0_g1_i4.p2 TRINITY_DN2072_c0_g1~~TRINITY_DN2072_c0_g1_i4.p2  ORF type:complete len:398 (-),score=68.23 TRINITY_DN2072_c0_g1_i4:15-1208(-)